ncbi:MAG: DUF935 family protein [Bacteroidales bacterium]|nr:DUF935 family protein [Bacteroidales bacterium]
MGVTRKKGELPKEGVKITSINVRMPNRSTQNIESWRNAIRSFENLTNPSRVGLYDLYDDIELDGQVISTWDKRSDALTNKRLLFKRDGDEDEEITKLLNSPDMRLFVKELHKAISYGFTLIQVNNIWYDEDEERYRISWDLIPRKHVHPEPGFECISKEQSMATKDFLYLEKPLSDYMVWAGDPKDKGILAAVAQYVIYKRGGFGDWAQFSEMFGMPFRELSYDDYDEATRVKLEQAMEDWGAAGYLIKPKGAELTLHDTGGSTSSADVYDLLISKCDAAISKIILGNTLTTEQGEIGSQALGEVHKEAESEKNASDQLFILSVLNTRFRAVLKRFGFNLTGGEIMYEGLETDWEKLKTKWDVVKEISDKVPVDDDFIYEEFDIPKPENYEEMKEQMRRDKEMQSFGFGGYDNDRVITAPADDKPRNFFRRLTSFFRRSSFKRSDWECPHE